MAADKSNADMARFNPEEVFEKIADTRLLPLFNVADPEICASVIDCCYEAGIRVFELTNRNEVALRVFVQLQEICGHRWPGLSLGAGTVLDPQTAVRYCQAGADFIITPDLNPAVGEICREAGVPWMPGCFSPTEISTAYRHGAGMVKLFPAGTLGPSYIRHIHGPMPFARIIVTGGVKTDEASVRAWLDAGVFALGIGSSLFTQERIQGKEFDLIREELKRLVEITSPAVG
jgi:2-dehydro-3-deoxyphosphogluconate aldolase/(4S)-4-hydroxy-2-oxoglutarate aldolase